MGLLAASTEGIELPRRPSNERDRPSPVLGRIACYCLFVLLMLYDDVVVVEGQVGNFFKRTV